MVHRYTYTTLNKTGVNLSVRTASTPTAHRSDRCLEFTMQPSRSRGLSGSRSIPLWKTVVVGQAALVHRLACHRVVAPPTKIGRKGLLVVPA